MAELNEDPETMKELPEFLELETKGWQLDTEKVLPIRDPLIAKAPGPQPLKLWAGKGYNQPPSSAPKIPKYDDAPQKTNFKPKPCMFCTLSCFAE